MRPRRLGPDLGQRTLELIDDQILAAEDNAVPLGFQATPQPVDATRIFGVQVAAGFERSPVRRNPLAAAGRGVLRIKAARLEARQAG